MQIVAVEHGRHVYKRHAPFLSQASIPSYLYNIYSGSI